MSNTIVPVLIDRVPEFAQELYPRFVQFLRDYLEFLESDNNFLQIVNDWNHNLEPSNEVEPYIDQLLADLGFEFKQALPVRKSLLLHLLREFYLSRGSESSYKFLFRALFNEDVSIRYPRDELLIPSAAQYGERFFIFTTANTYNTETYRALISHVRENGGEVRTVESGNSAFIEAITIQHGSGNPYYQIEILQPSFDFVSEEPLLLIGGDAIIAENHRPILDFNIINGGSYYTYDDRITTMGASLPGRFFIQQLGVGKIDSVTIENGGSGYAVGQLIKTSENVGGGGFSAYITSVGDNGTIENIGVVSQGYNYQFMPSFRVTNTNGTGAVIQGSSTSIGTVKRIGIETPSVDFDDMYVAFDIDSEFGTNVVVEPSFRTIWSTSDWTDNKGFLGENSILIDSDKYQQYSYTIVSSLPVEVYGKYIDEMLHPIGYVKASSFEISSQIKLTLKTVEADITVSREHNFATVLELNFESVSSIELVNMIVTSGGTEITSIPYNFNIVTSE